MREFDYIYNGSKVDLFHVTRKARKIIERLQSHKILDYQHCTDSLNKDDFNELKSKLGLAKSTYKTFGAAAWDILKEEK